MPDTNIVSHLVKQRPVVVRRAVTASMALLCLSSITARELMYGLAKRLEAIRLRRAVEELLLRVDVLPWDNDAAKRYGSVRADRERRGTILAPPDLLIATHALSVGAVLVTNDQAFHQVGNLNVVDWTH
jgi:tRNA(fMet)-specific endonuclease VapC